jgi:hypothetical protein
MEISHILELKKLKKPEQMKEEVDKLLSEGWSFNGIYEYQCWGIFIKEKEVEKEEPKDEAKPLPVEPDQKVEIEKIKELVQQVMEAQKQ